MDAENQEEQSAQEVVDLFLWANQMEPVKNEVKIELFLFNKNYTPYKIRYSDDLMAQVRTLFVVDLVNFVNSGAEKGLTVQKYGDNTGENDTVYQIGLGEVGRLETLLHLIDKNYTEIELFNEADHDFRRIKGIVAKVTTDERVFYIAKQIQPTAALRSAASWELKNQTFEPFKADIGIKIPDDAQVLVYEKEVFVFSPSKFERLFQFESKTDEITDAKIAEISEHYKLAFPDGLDLQIMLKGKKPLIKKLSNLTIGEISQDKILEYSDEMQLELMTDDNGAVIIMDETDLTSFINLMDEDYFVSPTTGRRFEVKSKKLMKDPTGGEPPRG
ncbi:MAG: DUF4868 domain-containing protein [Candidatus Nomurabacteria bacterium]|jgi:hypothetical protein|nr:DUF4868 domain-containing protein [Candidatus Nomurabacteria bacterium]